MAKDITFCLAVLSGTNRMGNTPDRELSGLVSLLAFPWAVANFLARWLMQSAFC